MAEILGAMNIMQRALPTGVDGTKIAEWQLREGTSYGALVSSLAQALAGVNQELVTKWGELFSITEEMFMEYPDGSTVTEMPQITDTSVVDAVRGSTLGHMLPLDAYGRAVGGTYRYFRDARQAQIMATIQTLVNQAKWRFEKRLFTRLMTNTDNAIGSAGYDVGFVSGTSGAVDYTPPAFAGQSFATSHNHYVGFNVSTPKTFADVFNGLAATLDEHGIEAPYTAYVSKVDVETISALTNFVKYVAPVVNYIDRGGESSGNQLFISGQAAVTQGTFGFYQTPYGIIELKAFYRIPTAYVGMFKSYGQLDARNPLAVRVHPAEGFGLKIRTETADDRQYPIKNVTVEMEFGIGVGQNRCNGTVGHLVAGGTYVNPTIA